MAFRGENVGTAYVRILAEGDGLDESIRKMFQDSDGAFDESGRRGSDRYSKAFEKEMRRSPSEKRLQNSITDAIAKGDFLSKGFLNGPAWRGFKEDLQTEFGDAGHLAGERLERELLQGMTFDGLQSRLSNIQPLITKAQDDILKNDRQFIRDRDAAYAEHERRMGAIVQSLNREFDELSSHIDAFGKGDRGAPARASMIADLERIGREMRAAGGGTDDFARSLQNQEDRLRRIHPRLTAFDGLVGRISNSVGKAFGKGSRNDFVNFIGSIAGGLVSVFRVIPRAIGFFEDLATGIRQAMQDAASEGAGSLRVAMAGVTATLESGGAALIAFGAAAVGAVFLIGPLVAIMSGLVGILAALAATVTFGLIGALAAVAGALVPLVGLVGGVALAFTGLSDAQKKVLKNDIAPITDQFKGLRKAIQGPIFDNLGDQAKRLAPSLDGLHPLFRRLGQVISGIGDSWIDAIDSPGFRTFRGAMETFLPDAVANMGRIIGNLFGGLGGIFVALTPTIEDFLGWVRRITGEFANWANSDNGRQSLLDFFQRASDSAKSLGGFITAALGFLGQLLSQGQGSGDNIFDRMAHSIENATHWLEDHPDAVAKWFGNAEQLASDIGAIVTGIFKIIDALDTANTRAIGNFAIRAIALIIQSAALIIQTAESIITGSLRAIGAAFGLLGKIHFRIPSIGDIVGVFQRLGPRIGRAVSVIPGIVAAVFRRVPGLVAGALGGLAGRVRGVFNRLTGVGRSVIGPMTRPFAGVIGRVVGFINGLPGRVRGIFNRLPGIARGVIGGVTRPFAPVVGRIMGFINGLPGRVRGLLNRLPGIARSAANSAASQFRSVPGRIMGLLSGIPGRVRGLLSRLGPIASSAASAVARAFAGIVGRIASHFSGVGGAIAGRLAGMASSARTAAGNVVSAFSGLAGRIIAAVGTIHLPTPTISMPHIPRIHIPGTAVGGVFEGLRGVGVVRQIGEAGPEAVVPLNRNLSQVDPSVRLLSAIAQGKAFPGMASGGVVGNGKTVEVGGINVYTVTQDPRAVAAEVFNRFAATAY